jgi:CheY-like chemotaxis protein
MMRIRFWGTRGSLAKPGPTTLRYGGNTSCVEVRTRDGTLIVLDCGTGAHGLGLALAASDERPLRGHLMLSHTHWDHIQGFPFFAPLFTAGNEWDIYAPGGLGQHLETTLAGQMEYTYFPVTLAQLGAAIRYHDLVEGSFAIGDVRVVTQYLNHPALALGYRVAVGGVALVYSVDHEPHAPSPCGVASAAGPTAEARPVHAEDRRHVAFLAGADLVVHDAQYTIDEYPQKEGWGHSPAEWAVDYAVTAGAKRIALFHHDPLRTDDQVDRLLDVCRRRAAASGSDLEVFAAAEGQVVDLVEREAARAAPVDLAASESQSSGPLTVLVADDDPTVLRLLISTLEADGFRVVTANDGESALSLARAERPALILLDWEMPGASGVEVTRRLRGEADPELRDTPVVLITAQTGTANTAIGFAAGVTDYLTKPFRPAHVRSRVQAWLFRRGADARGGET